MRFSRWPAASAAIGVTLASSACAQRVEHEACAADTDEFSIVGSMLGARCGSLDCHGQAGRPLRLYSGRGLRLDPEDVSGHGGTRTAEHAANLRAVVGLEPELTCEVFASGGAGVERLTLVRKATGSEHHVGGVVLPAQSDGRECLLTWLAGQVETAACGRAAEERPR